MKNVLLGAALFATMTSAAFAQATITTPMGTPGTPLTNLEPNQSAAIGDSARGFFWRTDIVRNDSTRINAFVPFRLSDSLEWRGVGQIFAPSFLYDFYSGVVYNETSNLIGLADPLTDQDWIDQFKGAGATAVDTVSFFVNRLFPSVETVFPGKVTIYGIDTDFNSQRYKDSGFFALRNTLTPIYEMTLEAADIDLRNTQPVPPSNGYTISPTLIAFDPPLEVAKGESMIIMYSNEDAEAIPSPVPNNAEGQQIFGFMEYRQGSTNTGTSTPASQPLPRHMGFGVTYIKNVNTQAEEIESSWRSLQLGGQPFIWNVRMIITGAVELQSGVRYHFGRDVNGQGISQVAPNPASAASRVHFSLGETSNFSVDLFDTEGRLVRNLATERYVRGNYSVAIPTEELQSGTYMVRLTVGSNVYTQKVVVTK